jgi:hypothetical protein
LNNLGIDVIKPHKFWLREQLVDFQCRVRLGSPMHFWIRAVSGRAVLRETTNMKTAFLNRWIQKKTGTVGGYILHLNAETASRFLDEYTHAVERGVTLTFACPQEAQLEVIVDGELIQDLLRKKGSAFLFADELVLTPSRQGRTHVELTFPVRAETLRREQMEGLAGCHFKEIQQAHLAFA